MKCNSCEKKLKLTEEIVGKCKCNNIFCSKHREEHNCSFDYKKENAENLTKTVLIKIPENKMQKI